MRSWLLAETHPDEAAFISDSRLVVPNLDGSGVAKLSDGSGVQISTNGAADQVLPDQGGASTDGSLNAAKGALRGVEATGMTDARLMTRMEFSNTLTMEYLSAKQKWELDRDAQMQEAEAKNDPKEMEKLTRKLAHITGTQNAILSNKYANAVVRGHTHTVRELLGHLDVRTTAEMLQDAKDALRESALTRSTTLPRASIPSRWSLRTGSQALDTGFTREDLSQTPELMEQAIHSKAMQIEALETRLATLRGFQVGNPKKPKRRSTMQPRNTWMRWAPSRKPTRRTRSVLSSLPSPSLGPSLPLVRLPSLLARPGRQPRATSMVAQTQRASSRPFLGTSSKSWTTLARRSPT